MQNTRITKLKNVIAITLTCLMITACDKKSDVGNPIQSGIATIIVGTKEQSYEVLSNTKQLAINQTRTKGQPYEALSKTKQPSASFNKRSFPTINQSKTIVINDQWKLTTELVPDMEPSNIKKLAASRNNSTPENPILNRGTLYNVVVFDSKGNFILEKKYTYGQEDSESPLELDGGRKYTFIAYSINSKTLVPTVTYANNNKTLASASITVDGNLDLMHFRTDKTVTGGEKNYLNIVLKHKLCQITTIINATATNSPIKEVVANISPTFEKLKINLGNSELTYSGETFAAELKFPNIGEQIISSEPILINAPEGNNYKLNISSLFIGHITLKDAIASEEVKVIPGVKYNLIATIHPNDDYGEIDGIPVVIINKQTWMRHNLGSNLPVDPDDHKNHNQIFGDYYQWGNPNIVAFGGMQEVEDFWYGSNQPSNNAWNLGTEQNPKKNSTKDPCPNKFRIPTTSELLILLDNTVSENRGTWEDDASNYDVQKVFTSKTNRRAKFIVPAQGFFGYSGYGFPYYKTPVQQRGVLASFWTSTITGSNGVEGLSAKENTIDYFNRGELEGNKILSHNIRCIYSPEK